MLEQKKRYGMRMESEKRSKLSWMFDTVIDLSLETKDDEEKGE